MTTTLNNLPDAGYLRLSQIIGNPKASPPVVGIIPASKATIWLWVKQKRFPRPVKLGPRVTAWSVLSIRTWLKEQENGK